MSSRPITQSELLQWAVINRATAGEDAPNPGAAPGTHEPLVAYPAFLDFLSASQNTVMGFLTSLGFFSRAQDPKWIDVILGRDEAVRMKECVAVITASNKTVEEKIAAFDEMEELVESLDNANDMGPLNLWSPIISVLTTDPEPRLRSYAAWVLGTAVQNNPKSQDAFLKAGGLSAALRALQDDTDSAVRAKALYCVSGAIKQNPTVFAEFTSQSGFTALVSALRDGDPVLMKRVLHLYASLIEVEDAHVKEAAVAAAERDGIASMATDVIGSGGGADADLTEKAARCITALASSSPSTVQSLKERILESIVPELEGRVGTSVGSLDGETVQRLKQAFSA
ncbi:hsp70 nucleotide exchange factor fes1 [Borealophlyctis nickersoniae]|nr:hsp70 nucleotide exchange factor fes1 [Borealophlyctis nickersoniae]